MHNFKNVTPLPPPGRRGRDAPMGHPRWWLRQWHMTIRERVHRVFEQVSFVVDARQADFVELMSGDAVSLGPCNSFSSSDSKRPRTVRV